MLSFIIPIVVGVVVTILVFRFLMLSYERWVEYKHRKDERKVGRK